jgi:acetoin utilization protein AcuC
VSTSRKVFLHAPALDEGGYPEVCPFNTSRAGDTLAKARSMGLADGTDREVVKPVALDRAALERFHLPEYVDALDRAGRGELRPEEALRFGLGTPDTPVFRGMFDYVSLAAGGTVSGARHILDGKADLAFNPSGGYHHAQSGNAAGFCFVNDIVLAAELLAEAGKRVLFLDVDVHHCDGVQDAFYGRPDVMTVSMHETGHNLFPGTGFETETGEGEGVGYSVNLPLPVGTYDGIYRWAFREALLPLLKAFDADVIIVELGMDSLAGDPLAHLHLTNNTPADILDQVVQFGKPVLATGGGGYNVENTVRGWTLCWSVLCGEQDDQEDLMIGMGGVMLENTDWLGGLRDRSLLSDGGRREGIDGEVRRVVEYVQKVVFPLHGV